MTTSSIVILATTGLYVLAGLVSMAVAAYGYGRKHVLEGHVSPFGECSLCEDRRSTYIVCFIFWWIMLIMAAVDWFTEIFERGGVYSKMPPKNGSGDGTSGV